MDGMTMSNDNKLTVERRISDDIWQHHYEYVKMVMDSMRLDLAKALYDAIKPNMMFEVRSSLYGSRTLPAYYQVCITEQHESPKSHSEEDKFNSEHIITMKAEISRIKHNKVTVEFLDFSEISWRELVPNAWEEIKRRISVKLGRKKK